jgi:hypothetical protein
VLPDFVCPSKHGFEKTLIPALFCLAVLAGCASMESGNTENLLTAAGFRPKLPTTPEHKAVFASMPDYKLQRMQVNGRWIYIYKDPKQGVAFVGGENEYQQYRQLALKQELSEEQLMAAQINNATALQYSAWGPWGLWY